MKVVHREPRGPWATFGFLLGIAVLLAFAGSLNYGEGLRIAPNWPAMTFPGGVTDCGLLTVAVSACSSARWVSRRNSRCRRDARLHGRPTTYLGVIHAATW